jgi:lipopolysaccharide/colanic/teichoic acid biosynthesis glycosyltransferase
VYKNIIKNLIDFTISGVALLLLLPVIFAIGLILLIITGANPIFQQKRPGKNEKIFTILKFKTMNDKRDNLGELLPDSQRLTGFGKLIRKTSLDELPQLINILKGEMSFIGPRPLLVEYLPLYNDYQKQRHNVKPGITGWAQVNGRNAISWNDKFKFDVEYIENIELLFDLKIFFKTIKKVFLRKDINKDDEVTMNRFKGN